MQLIFDNIVASMIGSVVLLILLSAHHRNQVSAAEASVYYMLQQQTMEFTGVIQRDMQNLSSAIDVEETSNEFRFRAQTELADTTKHVVTYRREDSGTIENADGELVSSYRIVRLVDGVVTGGSPSTITNWSIVALNEDEAQVEYPADTRALRVGLTVLPPIDVKANVIGPAMSGTEWGATFRPRMLRSEEL